MKTCNACDGTKPLTEFNDGQGKCKPCQKQYLREYYQAHRAKIKERTRNWGQNNAEAALAYQRNYRQKNAEQVAAYMRDYVKRNAGRIAALAKERYNRNFEQIRLVGRERYRRNFVKIAARKIAYQRRCRQTNPVIALLDSCRVRLMQALRGTNYVKAGKTYDLIGCTPKQLREHIESLWTKGMSWENRGFGEDRWHVDHIVPVKYFMKHYDMSKLINQQKCFHYTNLQPLWSIDNLTKGAKMLLSTTLP
jgi:hypothetical protein